MIKKTQKKFVMLTMGILIFVLAAVATTVLCITASNNKRTVNALLDTMMDIVTKSRFTQNSPSGTLPGVTPPSLPDGINEQFKNREPKNREDYLNSFRSFIIMLDADGTIISDDVALKDFDVDAFVAAVTEKGADEGRVDDVYYRVGDSDGKTVIVATDRTIENSYFRTMLFTVLGGGTLGVLLLLGIVIFLSFVIIKPLKESNRKQKQFISDASHELKTPLTIIAANAEVLESEMGKSGWLDNVKAQTVRMRNLVQDMLSLARLDEQSEKPVLLPFDLSKAVDDCVLAFDAIAFENGKTLETLITPTVNVTGDEKAVKKITTILVDNAVKYASQGGTVRVTLKKGEHPTLSVYNSGCTVKDEEREKVFERFYRSDASRARETGGSGLGLAIAKETAAANDWKLTVNSKENDFTEFVLHF